MQNINELTLDTSEYLQVLQNIAKPPKSLYVIGSLPESRKLSVAIVGARKVTSYGRDVGYRLAYELAQRGVVIISGLAIGMDGVAHRAALEAGGMTIAVLAGGLDTIYPASHQELAEKIVQKGGALLSEYPPEERPLRYRFLERNRLVSGLADVVLVVEAASRSGTLATAGFGLEQGKDVAAVPGNITSPMSAGCNHLIRTGATPVTSSDDVLELLGLDSTPAQTPLTMADNPSEAAILKALQSGVSDGHELEAVSKLDASEFQQTLSMLEITGRIRALGNNQWGLK